MTTRATCRTDTARLLGRMATLTLVVLLTFPSLARGQQSRKGFILNLGLGVARVSTSYGFPRAPTDTHTGLGTTFKIGYAATDQVLVYYSNDAAFHGVSQADALIATGLSGIGVTYFVKPSFPSAYVDGALGLAAQHILSTDDGSVESTGGWGLSLGGGYEFARHWLLDGEVVVGRLADDLKTTTLRVGLVWLTY